MNIYLTHTDSLMNHIFWFYEDLNIEPRKDHYGLSINYSDIKERRDDFLKELLSTIVNWVYNKSKQEKIFENSIDFVNVRCYNLSTRRR